MAHAGRHTHHVLAAKPHPITINASGLRPGGKPASAIRRRSPKCRTRLSKTVRQHENHPYTARRRPSPDKKPPKEPRRTMVRRHFRPETSAIRAILTPPSVVYGYLFYSADGGVVGCFFFGLINSKFSVNGGLWWREKKRPPPQPTSFSHHHKLPRGGKRLGISNGKQARLCPVRMEPWD